VNIAKSDRNESNSSTFSLSITPSICYSDASEWLLDTRATYHIYPRREWFSSLEKLDNNVVIIGNDAACQMIEISTVRIKMFDGVVRDLTDVRYVTQMKKNIISVGAVETKGLNVTLENGILKVMKGSLVVMKGIRDRNLYYLKGSTFTGSLTASVVSDVDATQLWHMRLSHAGEEPMQALVKQGLLKGTKTCKLKFFKHCVLGKKTKVKFGITIPRTIEILDYAHIDIWGPFKNAFLGGKHYFVSLVDDYSRRN